MGTGHIKLTIDCVETGNKFVIDLDMITKGVNIDLNAFDPDTASELFGEVMAGVIDLIGIRKKFLQTLQAMEE